ncbi:MAG: ACT domain-containing protein, partial [Deltaproteobacteria bacterium]|nr:ACT domain-containing protein [Deltaproteobacteria bacterium]
ERKKVVAEGAGAAVVAAAIEGKLPALTKKAAFVISGGNIDVTILDRVLRTGLLKEGRVVKVETVLRDVPGSLAKLTAEIAALKANILQVVHRRDAEDVAVGLARLDVILEVEGPDHAHKVVKTLEEKGYSISS